MGDMMINIPLDQIKAKISSQAGLSGEEIDAKIKEKLRALSGLISEEGAAHIVANELGVKLFQAGGVLQVSGVLGGMRNVDINVKVVQVYELREFTTERGPGKVLSMLVGDETGVIRIVLWNKQAENASGIKDGDVLKIVGGYVRENQGRKEIHVNDLSKVMINPNGISVEVKQRGSSDSVPVVRKKISEIAEDDMNIEVLATIVQVFDINFFEVCPTCNRRARLREDGFACQSHGKVTPTYNYVLNLYVDDGSDNIRVVLWREQIEQLLGLAREQMLEFKSDPSMFESVKHDLLGNMILISGKASKNQTFDRVELVASRVNKNPDPEAETKRLKESVASADSASNVSKVMDKPAVEKEEARAPPQPRADSKPAAVETKPAPESKRDTMKTKPAPEPKKNPDQDFEEMNFEEELVDLEDL
ncbi:hypothetical protein JW711_05940 [Candidatus Woesearchaeota archaeon]|nr:hypothetical protein [Candidatus Woesearchaeota archaeon]